MSENQPAESETSDAAPPATTEAKANNAPLDHEYMEALRRQAINTLWPIFDEEATKQAREENKKERLAKGESAGNAEYYANQIKLEKFRERDLVAVNTSWDNLRPQDAIEGMLSTQMITVHNAVMEHMHMNRIARENQSNRSENVQSVTKLIRAFASLVGAFNHHRGKDDTQQTITVQHVNVADGGQAVVAGNVSP